MSDEDDMALTRFQVEVARLFVSLPESAFELA